MSSRSTSPADGLARSPRLTARAVRLRHGWTALRWLLSTLAIVAPVLFFSTLITFALGVASHLDPAAALAGDGATPATIAAIRVQFGLDRPWPERYLAWIGGVLHHDLGTSWFSRVPVSELIAARISISASIAGSALLIGVVFGVLVGILAAVNQGRWIDRAITGWATIVSTLPAFIIAIALITVFSLWLRWLPSAGYVAFTTSPLGWLATIAMPAVALSVDVVADLARQLRAGIIAAMSENYVTGAIVRGISWRRILFVHVLRNGAGPAVSILGLKIPALIGGAVITESIFTMPGLGMLSADSALRGDVPVVQGTLVVCILMVLASNILVNILQGVLQPASRRRQ